MKTPTTTPKTVLRAALLGLLLLTGACGEIVDIDEEELFTALFGPPTPNDRRYDMISRSPVEVAGGHRFTSIGLARLESCGVTTAGALYCWGQGLARGNAEPQLVPTEPLSSVSSGGDVCALGRDGAAYCGRFEPLPRVLPEHRFTAISSGGGRKCGVTTTGAAYCWQHQTDRWEAVAGGLTFSSISASDSHVCGVTPQGAAYCWGRAAGLGHDTTGTDSAVPVPVVGGHTFAQVSAGAYRSCGVTTSRVAYCWGWGPTGDGTDQNRSLPTLVAGGHRFASISVGHSHVCAVTTGGEGYCWGMNHYGKLGDGSTAIQRLVPTKVTGGHTFLSIEADEEHTCGIDRNAIARCWGLGGWGQLGRQVPRVS